MFRKKRFPRYLFFLPLLTVLSSRARFVYARERVVSRACVLRPIVSLSASYRAVQYRAVSRRNVLRKRHAQQEEEIQRSFPSGKQISVPGPGSVPSSREPHPTRVDDTMK